MFVGGAAVEDGEYVESDGCGWVDSFAVDLFAVVLSCAGFVEIFYDGECVGDFGGELFEFVVVVLADFAVGRDCRFGVVAYTYCFCHGVPFSRGSGRGMCRCVGVVLGGGFGRMCVRGVCRGLRVCGLWLWVDVY